MLKEYFTGVCTAAVVCGIISMLPGSKGVSSTLIKLLCGLFMLVTVLSPLIKIPIQNYTGYWEEIKFDAAQAASTGQEAASGELENIITERLEAYIHEQANAIGADVAVNVVWNDMTLQQVTITGTVSPFAKVRLTEILTSQLDIPVEAQHWNE